jgi:aromatic-L-amino-acid decarboxylase
MTPSRSFHLTPAQFRTSAYKMIDWITAYYERIESFPVLSQVKPGAILDALPQSPPSFGVSFEKTMKEFERSILPGITHWQSPNFFAYFPANASGPAILGDLLSSGLGVQGMLWATSPSCTEVETRILDWLAEIMDLPEAYRSQSTGGGVIQDSASVATFCAILAARERATGFESNEFGCRQELVAYTSSQAHSSVEKGIKAAGVGRRNLRLIEVDSSFAMLPQELAEAIAQDKQAGRVPFLVCATAGTTSSLAFDPIRVIGEVCRQHGVWLHVDAAMAGTVALCPEFRWTLDGLELADSFVFDPHKWMFTNFDCSCLYVADRTALTGALSVTPEYLRNRPSETYSVIDYREWHLALGRRFRALKLWFLIQHYGTEGLRHHIRRHVEIAQKLAEWIREDSRFEIMAPATLNLICFRLAGSDSRNEQLLQMLNLSGKLYLSHTKLNDKYTLRFCVGQTTTELHHVERAWSEIRSAANLLDTKGNDPEQEVFR